MNPEELFRGESETIEYKASVASNSDAYMKTVIAFANGRGGQLLFGVQDVSGEALGLGRKSVFRLMDAVANAIASKCEPRIHPHIYLYEIDRKPIIIVDVPAGAETPYWIHGEGIENGTYVRVGATTRKADRYRIEELILRGQHKFFDQEVTDVIVKEKEAQDFCENLYEFVKQQNPDKTVRKVGIGQLLSWGILHEADHHFYASNGYLLLEGKSQKFAETGIQCAVFKGTSRGQFVRREQYDGPFYENIERAVKFIEQSLGSKDRGRHFPRARLKELDTSTIREVIANAVCHRSYQTPGRIQVALFNERIEVVSPGGLDCTLAVEDIERGRSRLRNPAIASVLRYADMFDGWGNGIPHLMAELKEKNLPEVRLRARPGDFLVRISAQEEAISAAEAAEDAIQQDPAVLVPAGGVAPSVIGLLEPTNERIGLSTNAKRDTYEFVPFGQFGGPDFGSRREEDRRYPQEHPETKPKQKRVQTHMRSPSLRPMAGEDENETDMSYDEPKETNAWGDSDWTNAADALNEAGASDEPETIDETDEWDETDAWNEMWPLNETDDSNESDESEAGNEMNAWDETDARNETDESETTSETDAWDEMPPLNETDDSNESDESEAGNEMNAWDETDARNETDDSDESDELEASDGHDATDAVTGSGGLADAAHKTKAPDEENEDQPRTEKPLSVREERRKRLREEWARGLADPAERKPSPGRSKKKNRREDATIRPAGSPEPKQPRGKKAREAEAARTAETAEPKMPGGQEGRNKAREGQTISPEEPGPTRPRGQEGRDKAREGETTSPEKPGAKQPEGQEGRDKAREGETISPEGSAGPTQLSGQEGRNKVREEETTSPVESAEPKLTPREERRQRVRAEAAKSLADLGEPELTETEKIVLEALRENPQSTQQVLSKTIPMNLTTLRRAFGTLTAKGKIKRLGNRRKGSWLVEPDDESEDKD